MDSNIKISECIFLYDGSFIGLLTVIHKCLLFNIVPIDIKAEQAFQNDLFTKEESIQTNEAHADKVLDMMKQISKTSLFYIYSAYLATDDKKEIYILKYLFGLLKYKTLLDDMVNLDYVIKIHKLSKLVGKEAHRFKGFTRFSELKDGSLISIINPDHNIIEILANHFALRLQNINWCIIDKKRLIVAIYQNKKLVIKQFLEMDLSTLEFNENELKFQTMWTDFFLTIGIKERTNKRCQMNFMPKKYWKDLTEMRGIYGKNDY